MAQVTYMCGYLGFPNDTASVKKMMDQMDKNKDQKVDLNEFKASASASGGRAGRTGRACYLMPTSNTNT